MIRRFINKFQTLIGAKELVGVDSLGNEYYKWMQKEAGYTGQVIERREVDFKDKGEYDPKRIPPEWATWLHKYRMDPPTAEESQKIAKQAAQRAARVAKLEAEEQQRKFRLASMQTEGMSADATPNMKRYVEQLTSLGYGNDQEAADTPSSNKAKPEAQSSKDSSN